MRYSVAMMSDYDQKVKIGKEKVFCYSKKQLDKAYPDGNYQIVGEAKNKNKKKIISQVRLRNNEVDVCEVGSHSGLLHRCAGYVHVGGDYYIALLKPRWPFLLILLGLLLLLGLSVSILVKAPEGPVILNPDHPLPVVDSNAQPIEDDDSEKADVPEGGGSVSMIYTLEARLDLSDGLVTIYFKNPNASSHNVSVDLIVLSGEEEYVIAQSGLLQAGYALDALEQLEDSPELSEGIYTGLYRLQCYDPVTGERALISPEITGVNITVVN